MSLSALTAQQTAALTDAMLAIIATAAALHLLRFHRVEPRKAKLWTALMLVAAVGASLGTITHGIVLPRDVHAFLWWVIRLCLWVATTLFAVATAHDLAGPDAGRRALRSLMPVALLFHLLNELAAGSLDVVVAAVAVVLTAAAAGYGLQAATRGTEGASLIAFGAALTIVGAALQVFQLGAFRFVWQFDHNGTCHLIQLVGLLSIVLGVRASFLAMERQSTVIFVESRPSNPRTPR